MIGCEIDGCTRPRRKRQWCETHYTRWKSHGTPHGTGRREQTAECQAEDCARPPLAKDLCRTHYYEKWWEARGGRPKNPQRRQYAYNSISEALSNPASPCVIDDCGKQASSRGWCGAHYQRWRRFGDPEFHPPAPVRECSVEGCERIPNARNLCGAHYRRWQLYVDPQATKHSSRVAGPDDPRCPVDGCVRRQSVGVLCSMHYSRKRKHGSVDIVRCVSINKLCATCGEEFDPAGTGRKYCGKTCKPSGRIAGSVNKRTWVVKLGNEDGWTCWLCNKPVDPSLYWPDRYAGSVDHVLPVVHGGTDGRSNLRLAHLTCNCSRKKRLLE